MKKLFITTSILLAGLAASAQNGPVRMWEGVETLPTYRVNAPEQAPLFERDFAYQRAKRGVYPYAMNDNPTIEKVDSAHRAVYLENDYLKVCVLPDIGGRLFYATDKTNGYEIFYRQSVIKPANVGMLGAWISGGVEWNVFHHHRNTTNMPVDCKIVENEDGSRTIWVGEVEFRHRMQWAIGITLRPGKSYMEINGRLINSTADDNSLLYWSNVATKVDEMEIGPGRAATEAILHAAMGNAEKAGYYTDIIAVDMPAFYEHTQKMVHDILEKRHPHFSLVELSKDAMDTFWEWFLLNEENLLKKLELNEYDTVFDMIQPKLKEVFPFMERDLEFGIEPRNGFYQITFADFFMVSLEQGYEKLIEIAPKALAEHWGFDIAR